MAVKWVRRLLGRRKKNISSNSDVVQRIEIPQARKNSKALFREYSLELEKSFFASILDASEEDVGGLSQKQKVQAKKVARLLVKNNLTSDKLPRRPASLPMLIKLLKVDDLKYQDISKILEHDPALMTKILEVANSPHFRMKENQVETLEQAVLLLGVGGLKKVIAATVMSPLFVHKGRKNEFYDKVWQWALLSGDANDKYAQEMGEPEGKLYLLGLIPALSFMIIVRALEECEAENPELRPIHPAVRKLLIMKISIKLCLKIRAQWGLSEEYDCYIRDAEKPKEQLNNSPLRDAVMLAAHIFLENQHQSPLDMMQLANLMSREADISKLISIYIKQS